MKKLLLGTVAAIMLTGAAQACDLSKFGPQNVFNKVELTEKDKCWLDNHATESYGIDGKVFWVKVGSEYFSAPITHIHSIGAKEWITKEIMSTVNAEVQSALNSSEELKSVKVAKETLEKAGVDSSIADTKLAELENSIAKADKTLNDLIGMGTSQVIAFANENGHKLGHHIKAGTRGMQTSYDDSEATEFYIEGKSFGSAIMMPANSVTQNYLNSIMPAIQETVEAAYDQGYSDGYADGYADGYVDGFNDGVASVK